jgi:hypothetical protein
MADSVCKIVEVVGTSISKAISRAISKVGPTLRHLDWFEVAQASVDREWTNPAVPGDRQDRVHTSSLLKPAALRSHRTYV